MDKIHFVGFDMDYTLVGTFKFLSILCRLGVCRIQVARVRDFSVRHDNEAPDREWIPRGMNVMLQYARCYGTVFSLLQELSQLKYDASFPLRYALLSKLFT